MLDETIQDHEVSLNGYDIVRGVNGGGVAIYVRNSITYKSRPDLEHEKLELITVEVFKPKVV